ncbi:MAG: helix-turn-helix transcriptional regulator [Acidimicrobiales bacterium]
MTIAAGDLIRSRRKDRKWTQAQLGKRLGVSQVAVSEWETGKSTPSDMGGLARELGIELDELFAAAVFNDNVVRAIWGQSRLPQETRAALVRIYEQLLRGSSGDFAVFKVPPAE